MSDFDDAVQDASGEIHAASEGVAEGYAAGQDAFRPGQDGYGETSSGYEGSEQAYHDTGYAVGFAQGSVEEFGQQPHPPEPGGNWGYVPVPAQDPTPHEYGGELPINDGNWGYQPVQHHNPTSHQYGGDLPINDGNWNVEPGYTEQQSYPTVSDVPGETDWGQLAQNQSGEMSEFGGAVFPGTLDDYQQQQGYAEGYPAGYEQEPAHQQELAVQEGAQTD